MTKKTITIILSIICAVGLACSIALYVSKDKTAPTITYSGDVTLNEGEDYNVLLSGVSAIDDKDGDVSDTLMIESVYKSSDTAKIVYCAYDSSYNVAKLQRIVPYNAAPKEEVVYEEVDYPSEVRNSKVAVINGTRSTGVSTYWQGILDDEGFTNTIVGTSSIKSDNTIIYVDNENYYEYLESLFPGSIIQSGKPQGVDTDLSDSSIVIVIGEDNNTMPTPSYNYNYNNNNNYVDVDNNEDVSEE